jgi:hypothetical protein
MIKITQVTVENGEINLTITYDMQDETTKTFKLNYLDLVERLKTVRQLLGRPLAVKDAKEALIAIVNQVRAGKKDLPESFLAALQSSVGVDLEA